MLTFDLFEEDQTVESFTLKDRSTLTFRGKFRNNWRQRWVEVYDHPTNPDKVVAFGLPFDGRKEVICVEDRSEYTRQLNGNWGTVE